MEGLIPFLIHAMKRQKLHQHTTGYSRCLSDGSRRQSYHLLASAGNSFNGSSHHRRTQSEFMPPATLDLQPQVEEYFVRSRSFKSSNNNTNYGGIRETHHRSAASRNYDYSTTNYDTSSSSQGIKKFHPS